MGRAKRASPWPVIVARGPGRLGPLSLPSPVWAGWLGQAPPAHFAMSTLTSYNLSLSPVTGHRRLPSVAAPARLSLIDDDATPPYSSIGCAAKRERKEPRNRGQVVAKSGNSAVVRSRRPPPSPQLSFMSLTQYILAHP
ncbi:hypothetical protein TorRG33x02_336510 [Trema orientale]|uniref:Uncharacterized protein n=1 Tax=Trema orientale TaxID=63057 RepID=A0A2P5B019_TREOI|nr:hypothetical protein TorRG33x02_336510 [Trema orientale]